MTELTGATITMCEIKFDESVRALIQGRVDADGMPFSEFVKRTALEKAEDMADTEAYVKALDMDDGIRYPMEEIVRMAVEAD